MTGIHRSHYGIGDPARMSLRTGLLLAVMCSASPLVLADTTVIAAPERLSHWLLRQSSRPAADLLALSWRSASDRARQAREQQALVQALRDRLPELARAVASIQPTGRVYLPSTDARWLEVNPRADPVLLPGDSVDLPDRSRYVGVVHSNGLLCLVPHAPGTALRSYTQACGHHGPSAWLVQPDGNVSSHPLAPWKEAPHAPPAPGAWIWAPDDGALAESTSLALARFLSTLGPADESSALPVVERQQISTPRQASSTRDLARTYNDWGVIGLWQMPTARQGATGAAALTLGTAVPYTNLSVNLQPTDWFSGGFRYTNISGIPYGPANVRNDQSYKDKSTDLKVRLLDESQWLPEVAVGWRDLVGTGAFSGEYFVASKRFGALDATIGLGFGYLGKRGNVRNPFGALSTRFDDRPVSTTTGEFTPKAYFRGPAALFGGVQYQTPWEPLIVKVEYDGNDYRNEYGLGRIKARTPFNAGVVWRAHRSADLALAVERGNSVLLSFTAHTQLDGMSMPKVLDTPAVPVAAQRPAVGRPAEETARTIESQTNLKIDRIEQRDDRWTLVARNPFLGYLQPQLDRALAAAHRDAPPEVGQLGVQFEQRGTTLGEARVDRDAWARSKTQLLPESERPAPLSVQPVDQPSAAPKFAYRDASSPLTYGVGLSYRQNLGGPDAFILYQIAADVQAEWRLRDDTWLAGAYRVGLIDNYDMFSYTAPSELPRVRTYLREYFVASRDSIPYLQLTHMGQVGSNHFYMAYGGVLETMYAGVGVEYLYRPVGSRVAAGVDINKVQQRAFNQKFGLRDYKADTGHATVYWDTGISDIIAKVSAGQYLAGDRGATVDLSRTFGNGVTIGAFATKTNVSAEKFGEGSFDKGIYMRIPFDALLPRSGPSTAFIAYNPLIRDGGAKLSRRYDLYDLTYLRDPRASTIGPPPARPY